MQNQLQSWWLSGIMLWRTLTEHVYEAKHAVSEAKNAVSEAKNAVIEA